MIRIQRRRTKGWRMPAGAVYVGRPSRWGNPFPIGQGRGRYTAEASMHLFRMYADDSRRGAEWLEPLRDKILVCWCALSWPCHADVLIDLLTDNCNYIGDCQTAPSIRPKGLIPS